jgi:hypothetical protein
MDSFAFLPGNKAAQSLLGRGIDYFHAASNHLAQRRGSPGMTTDAESYLTLAQATKHFPIAVSLPTIWRWATKGVRRTKLRTQVIGGRRFTTHGWIEQFLAQTAVTPNEHPISGVTRPSSATTKLLQQAGIAVTDDAARATAGNKRARHMRS